jgi:parallel beta-helix repeat protein
VPQSKPLTIQNYPGEAVWLDGSVPVTNWTASDSTWVATGWTPRFDSSPTYTQGEADGSYGNDPSSSTFVNPAYPLAAHPDMLFIDGISQRQVASAGQVTSGSFYADYANHRLILGSNPTGHQVRAADLTQAMVITAPNTTVRGIGIHHYATSVWMMGTVAAYNTGETFENDVISDNATQGFATGDNDNGGANTLRHVTVNNNGLMGIMATYADGLVIDGVDVEGNNAEHFNMAPASGGIKIDRIRNVTVENSIISNNVGPGFWADESAYNVTVANNNIQNNQGFGALYEISAKGTFVNNLITGNQDEGGLLLVDASDLTIWNNTIADNRSRQLYFVQDDRVASDTGHVGHDPRQPLPDPTVTWLLGPASVGDNIIQGAGGVCATLCVQDDNQLRSAAAIGVHPDGDVHIRPAAGEWLITWSDGKPDPDVFNTLAEFRSATDHESHGREFDGTGYLSASYQPSTAITSAEATIAQPVPAAAATVAGQTTGVKHLGAWLN